MLGPGDMRIGTLATCILVLLTQAAGCTEEEKPCFATNLLYESGALADDPEGAERVFLMYLTAVSMGSAQNPSGVDSLAFQEVEGQTSYAGASYWRVRAQVWIGDQLDEDNALHVSEDGRVLELRPCLREM
jgi:hypothetical protein